MAQKIPPGLAWLLVFLPTLLYVAITRLGTSHEYGVLVGDGLYRVADGFTGIVDMVWRHDSELGRGYVLLSESSGTGRVWRWELGGGPISIGKSLHLDHSGCRSARCIERAGSGALGIQFARDAGDAREGSLLVSEIGEGRIVRLEENGARTPLLIWHNNVQQGATCTKPASEYPHRMVMTATGDLIVIGETQIETSIDEMGEPSYVAIPALFQVSAIPRVPSLPSLEVSRQAHMWETLNHTTHVFWSNPSVSFLGGVAVTEASLFVSAIHYGLPAILEIKLDGDDEGISAKRIHDLSSYGNVPGGLVKTENAIFTTVDSNLIKIESGERTVILLPEPPTAVILGDDKYIYVSSQTCLYRYLANTQPHKIPTHLIARPASTNSIT